MNRKTLLTATLVPLAFAIGGITAASAGYYGSGYGMGSCQRDFYSGQMSNYGPGMNPYRPGKMGQYRGMKGTFGARGNQLMAQVWRLDLTTEQRNQLNDLRQKNRDSMQDIRQQRRDNSQQLRELMQSGEIDDAQLSEIADSQASLTRTTILKRADMNKQVLAILTDEQKARLKDMGPAPFSPRYR